MTTAHLGLKVKVRFKGQNAVGATLSEGNSSSLEISECSVSNLCTSFCRMTECAMFVPHTTEANLHMLITSIWCAGSLKQPSFLQAQLSSRLAQTANKPMATTTTLTVIYVYIDSD